MKVSSILAAGCAVLLCACAQDDPPQVADQLQRGATGQGTLYERDVSNDPFIENERN